jgi:Cu/Ag efflux protein CusF
LLLFVQFFPSTKAPPTIETLSHFAQKEISGTMTVRGMQAKSRDIKLELELVVELSAPEASPNTSINGRDPLTASRNHRVRFGEERKKREAVNCHIKGT